VPAFHGPSGGKHEVAYPFKKLHAQCEEGVEDAPHPHIVLMYPLLDREGTSKRGDRLTQQYTNLMELELYTLAQ